MGFERALVLTRYCHHLLGAGSVAELKHALYRIEEGPAGDGHSRFYHALAGLRGLRLEEDELGDYDGRIVAYEAKLAQARGGFAFKYFQYLGLLYAEIILDRLTRDPRHLLDELNGFLAQLKREEAGLEAFPDFEPDDLRRLAFFMATGSGKTLLMHVNLWQVLHYLQRGRHPEALVSRADGRREFDGILLVTPNEGLSRQSGGSGHRRLA